MNQSADEVTQAEALFVSDLQSSESIDDKTVNDTVATLRDVVREVLTRHAARS